MSEETKDVWLVVVWRHRYEILHHALLAATFAAMTLAFETTSHFAVFDAITRMFTSIIHARKFDNQHRESWEHGYQIRYSPLAAGDRPLVFVVHNLQAQASYFQLRQADLTEKLIRSLSDEKPELLAIGLILDPYIDDPILNEEQVYEPSPSQQKGQERAVPLKIDADQRTDVKTTSRRDLTKESPKLAGYCGVSCAAIESRKRLDNAIRYAATRTRVVLTAPPLARSMDEYKEWLRNASVQSKNLSIRQFTWIWDMCQIPNVWMATSWDKSYSDAYVYLRTAPILGNIAANALSADDRKTTTNVLDICRITKQLFRQSAPTGIEQYQPFFDQIERISNPISYTDIETINPNFYETLSYGASLDLSGWIPGKSIASVLPPGLSGKTVFIGEGTPLVETMVQAIVPIIDAQAAVFYSNLHALNLLSHADVFLIDLGIGTFLGFLFAWSWGAYARATDRMDAIPIANWWLKTKTWGWAKLFVLPGNLLLLAVLIVITWWLSNEFFRLGAWINPLPLVIGMSLKGLLGSRQKHVGEVPQSLSELINHHPDIVWQPFAIALSIGIVVTAH